MPAPITANTDSIAKQLGRSWLHALILLAVSTTLALITNSVRGLGHGGIPLQRKAPFDLYTDCPEIADGLPTKQVTELPLKSNGAVYLDSRSALEYCTGHIPYALYTPFYETEPVDPADVQRLKRLRGRWLVVYGSEQTMSGPRLASALAAAGVRGIYLLKGGLKAWKRADRPIDRCLPGQINAKDALAAKGPVIYVDARERQQFDTGHIPAAVWFPYDGILPPDKKVLHDLGRFRNALFVVYAGNAIPPQPKPVQPSPKANPPNNSPLAQNPEPPSPPANPGFDAALGAACELKARGFPRVKVLRGGLTAWEQAGQPLVRSARKPEQGTPSSREGSRQ